MKPPRNVPKSAPVVGSHVRAWDGATVEAFALAGWHRSHDRTIDGTRYWQPVLAVSRQVLWVGPRLPSVEAAQDAALAALADVP